MEINLFWRTAGATASDPSRLHRLTTVTELYLSVRPRPSHQRGGNHDWPRRRHPYLSKAYLRPSVLGIQRTRFELNTARVSQTSTRAAPILQKLAGEQWASLLQPQLGAEDGPRRVRDGNCSLGLLPPGVTYTAVIKGTDV